MSSKTRSGAPSSNNNKKSRKQSSHSEEEQEFEVEKILEMKVNPKTKTKEYLIKWKSTLFLNPLH